MDFPKFFMWNSASQTKDVELTAVHPYTPNQHQQHKWAALVWRGWLTSCLIIGQMPIPSFRNETRPPQRANYQSRPLRSQQEMTSGIHVICSACQRKSALHQIKYKHQLKSRTVEGVQSEIWSELPNNLLINEKTNQSASLKNSFLLFGLNIRF